MQRLKIAIVLGHALPVPPVAGGAIESRAWELAGAFAGKGHQVTVYSRAWDGMPEVEHVRDNLTVKRFNAVSWSASRLKNVFGAALWGRMIAKVLEPADAIICKNFFLPFMLRESMLLERLFIGLHRAPKVHYRIYSALFRREGRGPRLIAVSKFVCAATERLSDEFKGRVVAIPNPIDTGRFNPDASCRTKLPTILFAGRFAADKGLMTLLRAALRLHQRGIKFELRLAGPLQAARGSDDRVLKEMREFIAANGLTEIVRFVGFKRAEELADEYRAAWVFCYPSEGGEAWPNAVMESMACGTPVISTKFGPFPEMFTDGIEGFQVQCGADEELSDRLFKLVNDDCLRRRMARAALATALNYSLDKIADEYLRAFCPPLISASGRR